MKAKIVRSKQGVSKGYGFVSFMDPYDAADAMRTLNGERAVHCRPRARRVCMCVFGRVCVCLCVYVAVCLSARASNCGGGASRQIHRE